MNNIPYFYATLSQVIKEYAPVVSHHQRKSLPTTHSRSENKLKWSHE